MVNQYLNIPVPTPTQNTVPSADIRDHVFGGAKIDEFVTSLLNTYIDRLGAKHYTVEGLTNLVKQVVANLGFAPLGTFEAGAILTNATQTLKYEADNNYYRWDGDFDKAVPAGSSPSSTGGVAQGAWVNVTDLTLRTALASDEVGSGGSLVALEQGGTVQDAVNWIPTVGLSLLPDASTALSVLDAKAVAENRPILVLPGEYVVKNVSLGAHYIFSEGAYFVATLGERDNIIIAKSGLKLIGAKFKKGHSEQIIDGDYGNCVRIGQHRQPLSGGLVSGVRIEKMEVINLPTTYTGQGIEILGNSEDVVIDGFTTVGNGAGIICHWGGDVGDTGSHSSTVTFSHHPRNIKISNVRALEDDGGNYPVNPIIISACYDVDIDSVYTNGTSGAVWIMPGDVYNQVAVARDKDKVHTGIRVDGITVDNPKDAISILLQGQPATYRTSGDRITARDPRSKMGLSVTNATILCDSAISYTKALVEMTMCKDSTLEVQKVGGAISQNNWAVTEHNERCNIKLTGSASRTANLRGNTNSNIECNATRTTETGSPVAFSFGSLMYSNVATLNISAAIGSKQLQVTSLWSDPTYILAGSYILSGTTAIAKVTQDLYLAAGSSAVINVDYLAESISSGSSISGVLTNTGTEVAGCVAGFYTNYANANAFGITYDGVRCLDHEKHGILFTGTFAKDVVVRNSEINGGGSETITSGSTFDILNAADITEGFSVQYNSFDVAQKNPNIDYRVSFSNSLHRGVSITGNKGTTTRQSYLFAIANSTFVVGGNMQQIYGNSFPGSHVPDTTAEGQYVGERYRGIARNNIAPASGYWGAGDLIQKAHPTSTATWNFVCTTSGSPGTWVSI